MEEKYYWINEIGIKIPKHELSDLYICNIVCKFGKNWLRENGHDVIVDKFEELNAKYHFFDSVKDKTDGI